MKCLIIGHNKGIWSKTWRNVILVNLYTPLFKVPKICIIIFWKMTPSPLEIFQKIIRIGSGILPWVSEWVTRSPIELSWTAKNERTMRIHHSLHQIPFLLKIEKLYKVLAHQQNPECGNIQINSYFGYSYWNTPLNCILQKRRSSKWNLFPSPLNNN